MPYAMPMRRCFFLTTALALYAAAPARADRAPDLSLFGRLVGKCYAASIGPAATDRHCFEAVYGGKHLRDRHRVMVDGKVVYAGETIYSRSGAEIVFTYINTLGGVGHGKASAAPSGITFTGSMRSAPSRPPQPMDSSWRWQGTGYAASDGKGADVVFKPVAAK